MEDSLRFLAGVVFGGVALYKLTSQKDELLDDQYQSNVQYKEPSYQPKKAVKTVKVVEEPKAVVEESVEEKKEVVEPIAVSKVQSIPSYEPSWASKKEPKLRAHISSGGDVQVAKVSIPESQPEAVSITSSVTSVTTEDSVQPATKSQRVDYTPSWMSSKDAKVSLEDVQETITQAPRFAKTHLKAYSGKIQCGNASISRVAYSLSDTVFVYPLNSEVHFGSPAVAKSAAKTLNSFGRVTDVKVMETRAGAGSCVVGSLLGGSKTSVLASSDALALMTPTIFSLSAQNLPVVFHVNATKVNKENLTVTDDYSNIMKVRESGLTILASSSAQEIADFSVIAHVVAHETSSPLLHCFDGTRGLTELHKIHVPSLTTASDVVEVENTPMATHGLKSAATVDRPYIACAVQDAMDKLTETLGTPYKLFSYTGPDHPDSVVVAMGNTASIIEHAVKNSHSVGVIKVHLLRPWSSHHFLSALPKSVRKVCVIDQSGVDLHPLFLDVASALHSESALQLQSLPLLIGTKCIVGAAGFDMEMAHTVISNITSVRPQPNLVVKSQISSESRRDLMYANDVIVWSKGNAHAVEASKAIALELGNDQGVDVQYFSSHDPYSETHKSELRMSDSSKHLVEGLGVKSADVVVAPTIDLDVISSVNCGGKLIVTSSSDDVLQIPESLNSQITRNGITVYTLRADFEKECESAWASVGAAVVLANASAQARVTAAFRQAGKSLLNRYVENAHALLAKGHLNSTHSSFANDFEVASWSSTKKVTTPVLNDATAIGESFAPRFECKVEEEEEKEDVVAVVPRHQFAWNMIFRESYEATEVVRPSHHDVHIATITKNERLTPGDYSRNIFHMEFDISDTPIKYQIGDALGVFGHNDEDQVEKFIEEYGLDGDAFVAVPARGAMAKNKVEYVTVRNALVQHLDLFGRPSKKFYVALAQHAKSRYQYLRLMHIGTDDAESFKLGIHETVTYAELFLQYNTAKPSVEEMIAMIPEIKPRHYSISSSMKVCPRSVHLLVVAVDWETPLGKNRTGQCTRYLKNLVPGQKVTVDIQTSVLRLPPNPKQPIVMAGLGTGMAPFRAFIQERMWQKESGIDVGPCVLYFGARHKAQEWLYGEELEKYAEKGLVKLGLAWSRDQAHKVYIQHKITEDGPLLKKYLGEDGGYFYLCGPTWPVPDVRDAIAKGLTPEKVKDGVVDVEAVEELKDEGRYILEVY
eukprot:CAMPEP_0184016900 /NCGR_PEP_ID=MMETSP0954-20121128/7198_1 /TAXON_ID=627963 /ORGANISM="Aplanochytrium sp, Strain PBS07" /LENGTH=1212 /DNA_ID=CAMNT_0026297997 /DNA_START=91 /DNA_END=3729 /DNA_ORIENTATION=-